MKEGRDLILGLGSSGISMLRYLGAQNRHLVVVDQDPKALAKVQALTSGWQRGTVETFLEHQLDALPVDIRNFFVSPGVPLNHPLVEKARQQGVPVSTDIALFFAHRPRGRIVGITGTNGKSTVAGMVTQLLRQQGLSVSTCGNFGPPALEALAEDPDVYVLELSSFQLHGLEGLNRRVMDVAALLNLSPDHIDVHTSFADYIESKHVIFNLARRAVYNASQDETCPKDPGMPRLAFSNARRSGEHSVFIENNLLYRDRQLIASLISGAEHLKGASGPVNLSAAVAIVLQMGLSVTCIKRVLADMKPLPHRCERVLLDSAGRLWVNDSKGTNVAATQMAISHFGQANPAIHLLVGGDDKGLDLSSLSACKEVEQIWVFGEHADHISNQLAEGSRHCVRVYSGLEEAIAAMNKDVPNDRIALFSPACASGEDFDNYKERGEAFRSLVLGRQDSQKKKTA